jgi:PRTRC genetic system protein A
MSRKKKVKVSESNWTLWGKKKLKLDPITPATPAKPKRNLAEFLTPEIRARFTGVSLGELEEGQTAKSTQFYLFEDGVWCQQNLPMGFLLSQQSKWTNKSLPQKPKEWREGFTLSLPKLPAEILLQVVTFFKAVNTKYKAEAYASIFWDGTNYRVEVPVQTISGGRVKHQQQGDFPGQIEMMQVHSHDSMGAFFSGTDDKDEQEHGQRVYAVFGKLGQTIPESRWRIQAGGQFYDIKMSDIIEWPTFTVEQHVNGAELFPMGGSESGQTMQAVQWDPCSGVVFPDEWMEKVSEEMVTGKMGGFTNIDAFLHQGNSSYGGQGGYYGHQNWHDLATAHLKPEPETHELLVVKDGALIRARDYDCLGGD